MILQVPFVMKDCQHVGGRQAACCSGPLGLPTDAANDPPVDSSLGHIPPKTNMTLENHHSY